MVQLFGSVETSTIVDDTLITEFRIPAFSRTAAQQRAKTNARLKGLEDAQITGTEELKTGDLPGQTIYIVEVESLR
jgi:hypothetical protein